MEPVGAIFEGEWGSLGGMYNTEEAEFMAQMLGNFSSFPSNEIDGGIPSAFWATGRDSVNCSSDVSNDNISCFLQGSDGGCSSLFSDLSGGNYNYNYLSDSQQVSMPMDFCIDDDNVKKHSSSTLQVFAEGPMGGNEICSHAIPPSTPDDKQNKKMPENPKKRMRDSGDVRKNKRNVKKRNMIKSTDEEDNINGRGTVNRQQSSSSCCSEEEEESIASQEMNGGSAALNSNGKARAGRGSATDPQSLYARKRRERINERLRILQKLVPNGTKVDISTMLEEAVQYVKFLQLQIKLLSSDDLWMYAPIAYNGIDIGLDLKIAMPRK